MQYLGRSTFYEAQVLSRRCLLDARFSSGSLRAPDTEEHYQYQPPSKSFWQNNSEYLYRIRDFVADSPALRKSALYASLSKYCDYRLGVVMDIDKPNRPSMVDQLIDLQILYGSLLLKHGSCQKNYLHKSSEYDNAKSILLLRLQPEMERSRGAFYMSKGKHDDAKAQFINLQQSFQVRSEGQKNQMELEDLKIQIQEGYIADLDAEIAKNIDAMTRSKEIYGDGELLLEILPRLQQIGQKAESKRRALLNTVEEMRQLRDALAERNALEDKRDEKLLREAEGPVARLNQEKEAAWDLYEKEKAEYDKTKEAVDQLERQRNALASELASVTSRMSSVVHLKFDKSQEISDYNVAISTATSIFNAAVGISGIIYHSWKYYLFRAEMKEDTHNFIASVKKDAAAENTDREDLKEMLSKMNDLLSKSSIVSESVLAKSPELNAGKLKSCKDSESQTIRKSSHENDSTCEKLKSSESAINSLSNKESLSVHNTLIDDLLAIPNGPALCFAGLIVVCRILTYP